MKSANTLRLAPIATFLLLGAACATVEKSPAEEVRDDAYHGRYDEAVRRAASLQEEHPDDPEYESLHRMASVAWYLDQGRRATFADRDHEALDYFKKAKELDPQSAEADSWNQKTVKKLARTWLERGLELHASGKLPEAVEAYGKALEYSPRDPSALNGLGEAVLQINYREGMGKQYFEEGMRALSAYWLEQARSRFSYAEKYEPDDPKTKTRSTQVDVLLAQQRATVAKGFEADRRFGAARNEYRLAVALDPENADARAGFERSTNESKASALLDQARMEMVRMHLDKAADLIQEGEALTTQQEENFEGARAQIEQARLDRKYQEALTLERDCRYEEAIAKYAALLGETEYFKDAISRKETLEEYVRLAADLYEKARGAASDEERLENLRKIRVFWPEYKDVAAQLEKLEKP